MSPWNLANSPTGKPKKTNPSEPVSLASVAGPKLTLPALKDVLRQLAVALLAAIGARDELPSSVLALVPVAQVLDRLRHLEFALALAFVGLAGHNLVGASNDASLVPVGACALLPALGAEVAKLCSASAAVFHRVSEPGLTGDVR